MANLTNLGLGSSPNDGTGTPLRTGGGIINTNNAIIDSRVTGFLAYGDTTGGVALSADVWTTIPNNGMGTGSTAFPAAGITSMIDTADGHITPGEMAVGDSLFIRAQFSVTPATNNQTLEFRVTAGNTTPFEIDHRQSRMSSGSGSPYNDVVLMPLGVFAEDFRANDVIMQVMTSGSSTLTNVGVFIIVWNRKGG